MASTHRRSQSKPTRIARPVSSASTASAHSQEQSHQQQGHPFQQSHNYGQQQFNDHYAHLQPVLLQAAQHVSQQSQQENVSQDPVHQLVGFNPSNAAMASSSMPASGSYSNGLPLQSLDPNMQQPQHHIHHHQYSASVATSAASVEPEEKRKKSSAAGNATNDKELREMLKRNDGRRLDDVAAEVIATDRTSRAEKSKQLFAMLWLKGTCRKSASSVPRNRVYTKYADRCSRERVIPLNPASFGKLVRVIFPQIVTRRLGVRGESKYHYVDLELVNVDADDVPNTSRPGTSQISRQSLNRQDSTGPKLDFNTFPRLAADTASFPPQVQEAPVQGGYYPTNSSRGVLFPDINVPQFRTPHNRAADMYEYDLCFPSRELLDAQDSLDITMPDIAPYVPPRADPDTVENLAALYRTHCTSLIDSVRYCKERQFFRLYGSFLGTLTQPVQNLFNSHGMEQWVRKCDYLMYQKMIRNVSQLTLQVAPAPVLKFLDNVSKQLYATVMKEFGRCAIPVLEAKLESAVVFAHLVRQMLRVNSTAHAAAVMLTVDENRDRMWADYEAYVNAKRIIENELPSVCDREEVFKILTTEIRGMLLPLKPETWLPNGTFYQINDPDPHVDPNQETVIDRIAAFLTGLASRFPNTKARTLLHSLNAVGSAVVREITVENGPSFQGWWLLKVFIDEMAQWLASLGGFLSYCPMTGTQLTGESAAAGLRNPAIGSNDNSRFSSLGTELGADESFLDNMDTSMQSAGPDISRRHTGDVSSFELNLDFDTSQQEAGHDDSGVCLDETDFDVKFQEQMRSQLHATA